MYVRAGFDLSWAWSARKLKPQAENLVENLRLRVGKKDLKKRELCKESSRIQVEFAL
jgi:hypothetical protein